LIFSTKLLFLAAFALSLFRGGGALAAKTANGEKFQINNVP